MTSEKILAIKRTIHKRRPIFMRQAGYRHKKLEQKWRQPKGMHSKMRRKFTGKRKMPGMGYRSPVEARFLDKNGLKLVMVHNLKEAESLNSKEDAAIIARVGAKNRIEIIKSLLSRKVRISNMINPEQFIAKIEKEAAEKKEAKKAKEDKKKKSKEESLKKAEEKKKKEEEKTSEDKKKETEEEKRKVLEHKE